MTAAGFAPPPGAALKVEAALTLEIDGRAASITGSGQRLVMHLDAPGHTVHTVQGLASSWAVGQLATGLRAAGLRLDIEAAHGRLLSLGAGVDSALGRLGTGSRAVSAGSPRALVYLGAQLLRRTAAERRKASVAGLGAGVLLAAAVSAVTRKWSAGKRPIGKELGD